MLPFVFVDARIREVPARIYLLNEEVSLWQIVRAPSLGRCMKARLFLYICSFVFSFLFYFLAFAFIFCILFFFLFFLLFENILNSRIRASHLNQKTDHVREQYLGV